MAHVGAAGLPGRRADVIDGERLMDDAERKYDFERTHMDGLVHYDEDDHWNWCNRCKRATLDSSCEWCGAVTRRYWA